MLALMNGDSSYEVDNLISELHNQCLKAIALRCDVSKADEVLVLVV